MKNLFLLFIWTPLSIFAQDASSTEQKAINACIAMGTPKSMCLAMNSQASTESSWETKIKNLNTPFYDLSHSDFILFAILDLISLKSSLISNHSAITLPALPDLEATGSDPTLSSQSTDIDWNLFQGKYQSSQSNIDLAQIKQAYQNQFNSGSYPGGVLIPASIGSSKLLLVPHPSIQNAFWNFLQAISDNVESALAN